MNVLRREEEEEDELTDGVGAMSTLPFCMMLPVSLDGDGMLDSSNTRSGIS